MIFSISCSRTPSAERTAAILLLASTTLLATAARADSQDIAVAGPPCLVNPDFSYGAKPNIAVNEVIGVGVGENVEWGFAATETDCSSTTATTVQCAGSLNVTIPNGVVPPATKPMLTGTPNAPDEGGFVTLQVTGVSGKCGTRRYLFHVVTAAPPGGWGDPHMTTADGVQYDFQSAGEFTALRSKKFEVQTRQHPVPTANVPGPNPYTGLAVCVSIYSAVAVRIGSNRVSLQSNLSGQPDPSGLQLRVNGKLVTLTDRGIDLRAGRSSDPKAKLEGRIVKAADGGYEFDDIYGTQLVATPAYWAAQQTWYLNLNVYQTTATEGIWGKLAVESWLPALPNGSSLGPKPGPLAERYDVLYKKFAEAWRVTDSTSLFNYAPGKSTKDFTRADWPRYNPQSCKIDRQRPAQPTTPAIAARACRAVTNEKQKADCMFDVTITGETGFGRTYATMQAFKPIGLGWRSVQGTYKSQPKPKPKR